MPRIRIFAARTWHALRWILLGAFLACGWWIYCDYRFVAALAIRASIAGRGTTFLGIGSTLVGELLLLGFRMRNAQDDGGRMKRFIGALKNAWVPVLLIPACIWGTVFLWEYHRAFQVLVQNPPNINISWQHLEGYEVMLGGPLSTDPETMKDLEQYATEITRIDKSPVLLSQVVRFQFPYPVENIMLLHGGVESISAQPVIMPLSLGQNASMQRSPHYSNYIVTVKNGSSDMRCRIVILFRTKPYGWLVHVGPKSKADPPISPPPPTAPSYDPLHRSEEH